MTTKRRSDVSLFDVIFWVVLLGAVFFITKDDVMNGQSFTVLSWRRSTYQVKVRPWPTFWMWGREVFGHAVVRNFGPVEFWKWSER